MNEVQIVHHPDQKRWDAMWGQGDEARSVGFLSYELRDGVLDMQHTVVDPAMRGNGLGGRLVEAGLQHARAKGLQVRPTCPFIPPYMSQHPEHLELLEGAPKVGEGDG
ncbi:GNAT family N-acetyltransferase [Ornithinimicrobium sufpigmenti]|uniref:GNAT family N-acetyltransferase n=1 Tax=Ornithinimicrobium sufpigmenti TaxID=2508882 RepID=UPI00192D6F56|nr:MULTISPECIES: GNAT family N-acetyltransferase [unclassified Ornithinimicrobium]